MIFSSRSKLKGTRTHLKKVISLRNSSRQAAKLARNSFKLLYVLASLRDCFSSFPGSAWERCFGAPQCIAHTEDRWSEHKRGPELKRFGTTWKLTRHPDMPLVGISKRGPEHPSTSFVSTVVETRCAQRDCDWDDIVEESCVAVEDISPFLMRHSKLT
jgi:hypothetical protein